MIDAAILLNSSPTSEWATWLAACFNVARAWDATGASGLLKSHPDDFRVEENLGFEPDGEGEHLFLLVEKVNLATTDVQLLLAKHFRQPMRNVSFAGMKDKQARTQQWFSVLAGKAVSEEVPQLPAAGARVLQVARNSRKLRRGSHRGNSFSLRIRGVKGDKAALVERLSWLQATGVPNYFGLQRFGYSGSTLQQALENFLTNKPGKRGNIRGLQLSAARAFLFNQVLSRRVVGQCWNTALEGDLMALDGSASLFAAAKAEAGELQERLARLDIHPTGPLWGKGKPATDLRAAELELETIATYSLLAEGLVSAGLSQERRSLRLRISAMQHAFELDDLLLGFSLPKGSYATTVLRELLHTGQAWD
jgi:tRNA pseudouridine13 synthase